MPVVGAESDAQAAEVDETDAEAAEDGTAAEAEEGTGRGMKRSE